MTYTLPQIQEAWTRYNDRSNTVLQVQLDGVWTVLNEPTGHIAGTRARRVALSGTIGFPEYLKRISDG